MKLIFTTANPNDTALIRDLANQTWPDGTFSTFFLPRQIHYILEYPVH